ncbi:MAG: hypothetical protein QM664_12015 [Flavihumibacter sp.]
MKTLVMKDCGLVSLDDNEISFIDGGSWWGSAKGSILSELVKGVINNWDEVKREFVAGWNIDK